MLSKEWKTTILASCYMKFHLFVESLFYNLYQNLFKSSPDHVSPHLHCFMWLLWCWHLHWSCYSPSWDCICLCTGQAYLYPSDQTTCLACGWRRHMNSSGKNTPICFLTWVIGQWAISLRIRCWGSQVSRYHPLYLQRMHKMTGTISLIQYIH